MKFLQRLKNGLSKDRQTLRGLSFWQKVRFVTDYYRGYAFVFLCLCAVGFYVGDIFMQSRRETVLEGFFTNDEENLFPAKEISREFGEYLNLSPRQQVIFDDSLYVQIGSSIDYHMASQGKIVAYVSARELDFLVTTRELAQYYSPGFPLADLEEFLPEHLLLPLKDRFLYSQDPYGQTKACAVSLEGSRFEKKAASDQAAPHYLMIFSYTEHRDAVIRFLEYAFEE